MKIYDNYLKIASKYKLSDKDINFVWQIIEPICSHKEFIKRSKKPFYHHDTTMLSDHILSDTIMTYLLAKKKKNVDIKIACLIAMMHDLYEEPWQNNKVQKNLCNKHGFVHPIEAAINAITWYPNYFKNEEDATILIDGIIHHMYPFPVRVIDGSEMYLNNVSKFNNLSDKYQKMIINSTKRGSIGKMGIKKSKYIEGRIMSRADKKISFRIELKRPGAYIGLISGKNKKID